MTRPCDGSFFYGWRKNAPSFFDKFSQLITSSRYGIPLPVNIMSFCLGQTHSLSGRTLSGIVRIQDKLYAPSMQHVLSLILYKMLHIKYLCQLSSPVFGTFYTSSARSLAVKGLSACCPLLFFSLRRLSFCTFTNCIVSHN